MQKSETYVSVQVVAQSSKNQIINKPSARPNQAQSVKTSTGTQ